MGGSAGDGTLGKLSSVRLVRLERYVEASESPFPAFPLIGAAGLEMKFVGGPGSSTIIKSKGGHLRGRTSAY